MGWERGKKGKKEKKNESFFKIFFDKL